MTASRLKTISPAEPRVRLAGLLAVLQVALAACGGDNLLLPSAGQPAQITVLSGNGESGTVGQPLGTPIVVAVTDPEDRPVGGVEVAFVVPPGAEIAPNDTVLTGPDGTATVNYTLSPASGDQVIEARAKAASRGPVSTTLTVIAMPEAAVRLEPAGSVALRGQVGTQLPESLAVRAADRFGNGVAGIEVTWTVAGGSVSASPVITGGDGRAAVVWTLAEQPGTYGATASAPALEGSPVSFSATAVAAPSPALVLVILPSSTASAGVPLSQQPELQLQDPTGASLSQADVRVTVGIATGEGSLGGGTSVRSDANGRVRFEDLSIRGGPGPRTLIFAAEGFSPAISSEILVTAGPPAAGRSSASVPDGTAGEATPISITLEDEFGTRVEGAAGLLQVTVTGANEVANLPVSEQGNGVYLASYTPTNSGTDQIEIAVGGNRIDKSPFSSKVVPGPASPATTTAEITTSGLIFIRVAIVVTTRDAQGNLVGKGGDLVEAQLNGSNFGPLDDNGDGTYSTQFVVFGSVESVGITLNGDPIAGSPFRP